MKRILLIVAALLIPHVLFAKNYATSFAVSENPLSESGKWLNGGVCTGCGVAWNNIKTTSGYAQQAALGATGVDDGTAVLTGTWGATQTVMIQGKNPTTTGGTQEIEIRLRTTITPNSITGYEVDLICGGNIDIVRWNGPSNNFTFITNGTISYNWCAHTNPIIKATMSGSVITVYDCSTGTCSTLGTSNSDTTYTTGNPGIGTDITIATTGTSDFGITQFLATDVASIYNSTDCNRTNVNAVINGGIHTAVDGDVIWIPSGSCSWSSGITVPTGIGIFVTGSGTPNNTGATVVPSTSCATDTTITLVGATAFIATPNYGNSTMRVSCMTMAYGSGGSIGVAIEGGCTAAGCPNLRLDNITFASWSGHTSGGISYGVNAVGDMFGVVDHNRLAGTDLQYLQLIEFQHASLWGIGSYGDNAWHQSEMYGSANALYIENNTFNFSGCCENEGDAGGGIPKRGGGHVVVRFNEFSNSDSNNFAMGWHGTESNGRGRGARMFEFYANDWNCNEVCGQIAGGRSATGLVWGNTLFVCPNTSVCALNSFFTFTTYRTQGAINWGVCDGSAAYDINDGVTYYSGTIVSGGGSAGGSTLTVSGSPGWTNDQWIPSGAPYSIHDVTQSNGAEITTNTSSTVTINNSGSLGAWTPQNGDSIQVLRATACIDQAGGRGAGFLYTGSIGDAGSPAQSSAEVASSSYLWNNNFTGRTTFFGGANFGITSQTARVIRNRDFYSEDTNQGIQTTASAPFNGGSTGSGAATGMGWGTHANRPTNCTVGVGYFETDTGPTWNDASNSFYAGNGNLYRCTATNTWTLAYTPFDYPHPLITGKLDTVAPAAGNSGTITTASVAPTSMTLNWTKATDATYPQSTLFYEVCQSGSTISTIAACEAATLIQPFALDIATFLVTGLTNNTTYHFNVVAMDPAGNKVLYSDKSQLTGCGAILVFTGQPNNVTVGAPLGTVTVTVQDGSGNNCGSDTTTITITNKAATCTGMTLSGTVSGANIFTTTNLTESAAGACTLHASDATDGIVGDSNPFTISASGSTAGRVRLHQLP